MPTPSEVRLGKSRVLIEHDGETFECYRFTAARAAQVFGTGVLRLLSGEEDPTGKTEEEKLAILSRRLDVTRKIFAECAIKPRPGDVVQRGIDDAPVVLSEKDFDDVAPFIVARLLELNDEVAPAEGFAGGPEERPGPS